jgi:hypothetical protein
MSATESTSAWLGAEGMYCLGAMFAGEGLLDERAQADRGCGEDWWPDRAFRDSTHRAIRGQGVLAEPGTHVSHPVQYPVHHLGARSDDGTQFVTVDQFRRCGAVVSGQARDLFDRHAVC